jgi:hypothetical protein
MKRCDRLHLGYSQHIPDLYRIIERGLFPIMGA